MVSAASVHFAPVRVTLAEALLRFDSLYRRRKREAGVLDFSDLEESALRLLRNRDDIREEVSSRFDQILMDEFQDTNGLQAALLALIRPGDRFYAVGDINQSIYGFRHADPGVFRAYRQHVESSEGRLCELRENWRSRAGDSGGRLVRGRWHAGDRAARLCAGARLSAGLGTGGGSPGVNRVGGPGGG